MAKFQKGVSGNPGGRPKMSEEDRKQFEELKKPSFEVLRRCLKDTDNSIALRAAERIFERLFGKVPQPVEGEDDGTPIRLKIEES